MRLNFTQLKMTAIFLSIFSQTTIAHEFPANHAKNSIFEKKIKESQFNLNDMHFKVHHDHNASTLVISCVDFRLQDEKEYLLDDVLSLKDDYDEVSIPGASLIIANDKYPHWTQTVKTSVRRN